MSNKQLITALGICLSLSSTIATAETKNVNQPNTENTASFDSSTVSAAVQQSAQTSSEVKTVDNNTAIEGENKPTLIARSLYKIGEIGNQSIEQIGTLSSKIAVDANASQPDSVKDPFEHFNRKVFYFNTKLDQYIFLPVARTYKRVLPPVVQKGFTQFFKNLSSPWTAVNNLLQGHPGTSIESLSSFVINTTTTLGFYDVAGLLGIQKSEQDFGQTLGVWGIGTGPYLMLPALGPSTVRDTFGRVFDQYGAPQNYLLDNTWESIGVTGLKYVGLRARAIGFEHFVEGDQYTLLRDIYLQKRQFESGSKNEDSSSTNKKESFGDDGFGDSDFGQQKSENIDSPVKTEPHMSAPAESGSMQTSAPVSSVKITSDTPMDMSAAVILIHSAQI
ncbi:MAG: VacJ family lipoprotein [Candidatus Saccharibacteria bacterium]|nr:VacJ family lipoprotein [Moraxellaceae bacterium]